MKIYISAGFTARERLRPIRDEMWKMGHEVVSTWLDETAQPENMERDDFYCKLGIKDVAEVQAADLLISDHLEPSTSGGRDIEFGLALGRHQHVQVWMVGQPVRLSPFHLLVDKHFADWDGCLDFLRKYATNHD
jgi:hypothetical protein